MRHLGEIFILGGMAVIGLYFIVNVIREIIHCIKDGNWKFIFWSLVFFIMLAGVIISVFTN